ncbi:MAG: hypothetical protein AAGE96_13585 [Cyanobacteria bacterium P01_G01_bin.19]
MTLTTSTREETQIREIKEVAIMIAIENLDPRRITEEFIKVNQIINSNARLTQAPHIHHDLAQLAFDNGVTIIARQNGMAFIEKIDERSHPLQITTVATQCIAKLSNINCQGLKIEAKRLIPVPNQNAPRSYLTEFLVASGAWQNYGQAPVKTGINFLYDLGRCKLNMAISEATIKQENKNQTWQKDSGGLLFSGTFTYPAFEGDKLTQAKQAIANSQSDWQEYNQIIDRVFLNREDSLLQKIMFH